MDQIVPELPLMNQTKNRRRVAWVLTILVGTVLSAVIIPVALIMPFRPQSQNDLLLDAPLVAVSGIFRAAPRLDRWLDAN
jgi:hypothetical protein